MTIRERGRLCPPDELSRQQRERYICWRRREDHLRKVSTYWRLPVVVIERCLFVRHLIERGKVGW